MIARIALAFTEWPAKAPFRSTTCSHSKPAASKAAACAVASSLKIVACAMSPWRRRTQRPSFRSMAGNRITRLSSRPPFEEAFQEGEALRLAFLRMELSAGDVVAADNGRDRSRVVGGGEDMGRV